MPHSDLKALPIPFRVYALEGAQKTQDEAIVRQGVTLAVHDERLNAHGETLATHTEALANQRGDIVTLTTLMKWGLGVMVGFAFTVAAAAVVFALSVASAGGA